jgi:hypothetical protein
LGTAQRGAETIDDDRHDRVRPCVPLRRGYTRQRAQEQNDVGGIDLFAHVTSGFPPVKQHPERFIEPVVLV